MNTLHAHSIDPRARRALLLVLGLLLLLAMLGVVSCAPTQPPRGAAGMLPGFLAGLWHGIIAPIVFFVSLFSDTIRIYAYPNAGRWYDLGFMLGIGGFSHGVRSGYNNGTRGSSARRRAS